LFSQTNITVIISDMERAIKFYERTLGLKLKTRYGQEFAQLEAPGATIALHPSVKDGPRPGNSESLSIGFAVGDLDSAMAELEGKGVKFTRVVDDAQVRLAFFTDPDGNPLYLSQPRWG